ncbi:hypothetical protein NPIL_310011 [Nephila pilipes]|uniref:Uncharacterized protein n=1 Tax=Nephila pilipes TaxID=299642 RepID=A0A8X6PJ72_NEPPI|nr:hypothetical protein NPIL_310011 [Nephila pilipes]
MCQCLCLQLNCQSFIQNLQTRTIHKFRVGIEYKPSRADSYQPFSQIEFNDLIRDLGLSKYSAEFLCSRLKGKKKTRRPKEPLFIGAGIEKKNLLSTLRKMKTYSIVQMFPD